MSIEQEKTQEPKTNTRSARIANNSSELVVVTLKKCGDEGADAGLLDLYQSLGYQMKAETPAGSIQLEMSRDKVQALSQAAIEEHYRRVKGAQRASVGPDVHLVEDKTEVFTPKSATEFIGKLGLDDES